MHEVLLLACLGSQLSRGHWEKRRPRLVNHSSPLETETGVARGIQHELAQLGVGGGGGEAPRRALHSGPGCHSYPRAANPTAARRGEDYKSQNSSRQPSRALPCLALPFPLFLFHPETWETDQTLKANPQSAFSSLPHPAFLRDALRARMGKKPF